MLPVPAPTRRRPPPTLPPTGVDALAVAVGSSHAMLTRDARLDTALIRSIAAVASMPLVLHGSSGVPDEGLAEAVRHGIVKINIATQLNKVLTSPSAMCSRQTRPGSTRGGGFALPARPCRTRWYGCCDCWPSGGRASPLGLSPDCCGYRKTYATSRYCLAGTGWPAASTRKRKRAAVAPFCKTAGRHR